MINPAISWFEIVELPTVTKEMTVPTTGKGKTVTFVENTKVAKTTFDKSSAQIRNLVLDIQQWKQIQTSLPFPM
jgi:hypothetical protein